MNTPLPPKARPLQTVDFIQGLALLGMLLIDAQAYSLVGFLSPQPATARPLDQADRYTVAQFLLQLLVNGPFQGLFSVGLGWRFYQFSQRAGRDAARIARRGLGALLAGGLLYSLVKSLMIGFDAGLLVYALPGFTLLYFQRQAAPMLLGWIGGLVGFSLLIDFLFLASSPGLAASRQSMTVCLSSFGTICLSGVGQPLMGLLPDGVLNQSPRSIQQGLVFCGHQQILVLVGLLIGKRALFNRLAERRVGLSLLLLFLFPLAIMLKSVASLSGLGTPVLPGGWRAYEPLLFALGEGLGAPLLTLVYVLEIELNSTPNPHPVAVWVGQLGRMSLTGYVLQSGLTGLLYSTYGLGLSGRLSPLESAGVVLALYGLGLWFSHWWLSHHQRGPVEQLLYRWSQGKAMIHSSVPLD